MNPATQLKLRKADTVQKLKSAVHAKIVDTMTGSNFAALCKTVASNLLISDITVINYYKGNAKDGFLLEAMIIEFEKL